MIEFLSMIFNDHYDGDDDKKYKEEKNTANGACKY